MKRWKWILIAAVLVPLMLAGGLFWLGGRTQVYRASIEIAAEPGEVFPYLVQPELITQWVHGVTEVRPLNEGGHAVGARALVIVEDDGHRYEFIDEVVESEANRAVAVQSSGDIFTAQSRWLLTPSGEGTRVEVEMRANFRGFFRFFAPTLKSQAQRQLQTDFENLKRLIESTPDAPAAGGDSPAQPIEAPTPVPPPAVPLESEDSATTDWMMT